MTIDARSWARRRTPVEWAALGAGVATFAYVGWDGALWDARFQLLLHLLAIGAILGLGALAWRGGALPRTPIELPLLGLLAAFALATVSALNVGMSLRAMAAVTATAAMLPLAIIAVRARPTWVAMVATIPVLAVSVPTLLALLGRRLLWILAGAPGLPPLRLPSEGTPFGSVAVPPFVLLATLALSALIEPPALRRWTRIAILAVGIPLTILSGSRSAWLAIAVTGAVALVPWAWSRRSRLHLPRGYSGRSALIAAAALAGVGLVVALVVPRLTAVTSLIYRGALWRDTLQAWSSDPILGLGPGIMPYARQAAAPEFSFPVRQPHSHNLPLGVLGDAGIVGLVAAIVLVVAFFAVAGPWRARTDVGRAAGIVLIGLAISGLFEDLTFLPNFNLLVVLLAAAALLDAGAVTWAVVARPRRRWLAVGAVPIAAVLLGAMIVADAGAIAYRAGIDAGTRGDWATSSDHLARAVAIDAWHPAGPRALTVAAEADDRLDLALRAARDATELNPGDATAWTNLALVCGRVRDRICQEEAALRAVPAARYLSSELLNAALILNAVAATEDADEAYRLSLLTQPQTSFVVDWPRTLAIGAGTLPEITDPSWQLNLLLARHDMGEPVEPSAYDDPAVRALAHAIRDERAEAEEWLARGLDERPADIRTWDIAIVLRSAWGEDVSHEMRIASVVRGREFPGRALELGVPGMVLDIGSFRAYPRDGFVSGATRLITRPPFPWTLAQTLP